MKFPYIRTIVIVVVLITSLSGVNSQSVTILQKQVPVLTLREGNQVMLIKLESGKINTIVSSVSLDLTGTTDLDDLESIKVFYRGDKMQDSVQFGKSHSPSRHLTVKGHADLISGTGYFSIIVKLKDEAELLNSLLVKCTGIKADRKTLVPDKDYVPLKLRFGTALCQHWEDGVHTYRIPGIVRTNTGTLLAIFDRRLETHRDLQGVVNIGLKRSTDGGRTWEPQKVIIDRGNWGGLPPRYNGVSDACILVNEKNNEIFVGALWMHGQWIDGKWVGIPDDPNAELGRKNASMPGMTEKETCQFLMVHSTDDGQTWSEPENLTQIKKPEWPLYALSPTNGITLYDGTLVFPSKVPGNVALTYSKDGGETWQVSNLGPKSNGAENAIVQLDNGSIMLNARAMGKSSYRTVFTTPDLGETWIEHPTNNRVLVDPGCHASLFKHVYESDGKKKSILFFSNPNSANKRERMTIKASFDEGMTWPEKYWILLDEGRSAYSSITSIDNNTIGILYEGSQAQMTFQKIPIAEFIDK